MPAAGISMRKIKSILRLHFESKLSQHQIASSLKLSVGVVNKYIQRATTAGLGWPLPAACEDEQQLQRELNSNKKTAAKSRLSIDFGIIHQELRRKGVTLQLLWEEYSTSHTAPVSYSHFCLNYRAWLKTQPRSMRQSHKAGDKIFVDYAGQTVDIIDERTGEIRAAQIFVGVLGASNYTFAEATWSQKLPDWIGSNQRMLEFFGGVPALIVPDNLKSGVTKACRYEPDINPTYADFIDYYGTAVLPARPRKPKDKAKAECSVLIVERWILARLRHQTFFGLAELNQAISRLLQQLNHKPFKKLPGSRHDAFIAVDKPALKPLPARPYEYSEFKVARAHIDYHVELEGHYYSVPHSFVGKKISLRFTQTQVTCWHQGNQIAIHTRNPHKGGHTTLIEHMPKAHQKHLEWTPGRFKNWATQIGPACAQMVNHLLESRPHPEQGYRSCLGLLSLAKMYNAARLESACEKALFLGAKTRRSVASILSKGLDKTPFHTEQTVTTGLPTCHDNIRGKQQYH